jgi:hypothetical protein
VIPSAHPAKDIDAAEAKQALVDARIDDCEARGLRKGYGHVRVTFAPSGYVSRAVVDLPRDLSTEALACIGEHLGAVTVVPFAGSPVVVGATWLVKQ